MLLQIPRFFHTDSIYLLTYMSVLCKLSALFHHQTFLNRSFLDYLTDLFILCKFFVFDCQGPYSLYDLVSRYTKTCDRQTLLSYVKITWNL